MKWLIASTAAIALAASGALAQPGNGNGNGNANGNGNNNGKASSSAQSGNQGNGAANRGGNGNAQNAQRANGGNNGNAAANRTDRGNAGKNDAGRSSMARDERGNSNASANRGNGNAPAQRVVTVSRGNGGNGNSNTHGNRSNNRGGGDIFSSPARYLGVNYRDDRGPSRYTGLIDGCPPGLAAKYNGCRPPGQAKKDGYIRRSYYDSGWWGLPRYGDNLLYNSGFLLRMLGDGSVGSYIPLLAGALSPGNAWPGDYGYRSMSPYYVDYYDLGGQGRYRYADNVIYRTNPETSAITSIAALLTGDDFAIGQPMPRGYDIYNVPGPYRERYYDRPDAHYRYSDGYIYQVDPETRLIAAAIELLV